MLEDISTKAGHTTDLSELFRALSMIQLDLRTLKENLIQFWNQKAQVVEKVQTVMAPPQTQVVMAPPQTQVFKQVVQAPPVVTSVVQQKMPSSYVTGSQFVERSISPTAERVFSYRTSQPQVSERPRSISPTTRRMSIGQDSQAYTTYSSTYSPASCLTASP